MNHSIEGTISPARSSLPSFCSADRRSSFVAASSERRGLVGGSGSGMNAETVSPASAVRSYLPAALAIRGLREGILYQGSDKVKETLLSLITRRGWWS